MTTILSSNLQALNAEILLKQFNGKIRVLDSLASDSLTRNVKNLLLLSKLCNHSSNHNIAASPRLHDYYNSTARLRPVNILNDKRLYDIIFINCRIIFQNTISRNLLKPHPKLVGYRYHNSVLLLTDSTLVTNFVCGV